MRRRAFIRIAAGAVIAPALGFPLAGCAPADGYPPEAVQAWRGPARDEADVRRWLLGYAVLAPHSHNLQSWLVDLRWPGEIMLSCDLTRLLPQTDPFSRQIMLSHGSFLELLDLAARQRGLRADIELFPEGVDATGLDARPVARIRLRPDSSVAADPLFGQILARRTNREPYLPREPAAQALRFIAASTAPHPGVRTGFVTSRDEPALRAHRALAAQAWRIELTTPHAVLESYRVLRIGPAEIARHRDGLSLNTPLARALTAVGLFDRSRAPGPQDLATTSQLKEFDATIAATPAFFWMVTQGNDRCTQIAAGRAYVRAQLAATAMGLSMQPLSQALQEYPEQTVPHARIHALLRTPAPRFTVQMWTRLGHGPAVGPSPRRGVDAHVVAA